MAKGIAPEEWVPNFRQQIRATTGVGWSVSEFRGQPRLQAFNSDGRREAVVLKEYRWSESATADILLRIRQIYKRVQKSESLKAASALAAASSSKNPENWEDALLSFKNYKLNIEGRASEKTWKSKYEPVLLAVIKHQTSNKPAFNSTDLSEVVLCQWEAGTRQRQISRQNLNAFLEYSVNRLNFKGCWAPPKAPREKRPSKRIGYPLSDEQILQLLDGLPTTEAAERWRFAIELLATYGLRPDELRYLKLRKGAEGTELWCTYRKISGGGQTMERRLVPLFVNDQNGQSHDWRLIQRVGLEEELPPLGKPGKGGEALGTYLRRLAVWKELQAEAKKSGETLTPYSFRHRFAQQSHQAGIPVVHVAEAMGHSIAVHLTSYARFTPSGTVAAYAQINK